MKPTTEMSVRPNHCLWRIAVFSSCFSSLPLSFSSFISFVSLPADSMASFLWLTNWSEHNNRNKNGHQEEEWEKGSVGVRMLLSIFRSSNNDPLLPIIVGVQQKRAHIQSFHIFHIPHTIQLHIPTYRHTNITYRQNRRKATERRIRNKMEIFFGYYKICCFIMKINKYIVI